VATIDFCWDGRLPWSCLNLILARWERGRSASLTGEMECGMWYVLRICYFANMVLAIWYAFTDPRLCLDSAYLGPTDMKEVYVLASNGSLKILARLES
jgi:hypothetical protein